MKRNRLISFFLISLVATIPLVYSCGGGGTPSAPPVPIMLASVDSAGTEGNSDSRTAAISSNGRYVAFSSLADNLVGNDTNIASDVFVHDTSTGTTSRVSVNTAGTEGSNDSYDPSVSSDGRYVAFSSLADNLVGNDTNGKSDVFFHDTATGITSLVSVSTASTPGNNDSYNPSISSDGRYVAFESVASNLVPNDTNILSDIFLRDTASGTTSRVSVSSTGIQGNSESSNPSISSDGSYVAFHSRAGNLTANDTTFTAYDVFAHDTSTGITSLMSVSTAGTPGSNDSYNPSISSDGRYVAFYSWDAKLVADDTNNLRDIFVRDTVDNITSRVSLSAAGIEGDGYSFYPSISSDGQYVAFESTSTNLIAGTTLSGVSHIFRAPRP